MILLKSFNLWCCLRKWVIICKNVWKIGYSSWYNIVWENKLLLEKRSFNFYCRWRKEVSIHDVVEKRSFNSWCCWEKKFQFMMLLRKEVSIYDVVEKKSSHCCNCRRKLVPIHDVFWENFPMHNAVLRK